MWKTIVIFVCSFFCIAVCLWGLQKNRNGVKEPKSIGSRYLDALSSGNKSEIERLIHPNAYNYTTELDEKLARYVQLEAKPLTVDIVADDIGVGGGIILMDKNGRIHDKLFYLRYGSRWYIVVGQLSGPGRDEPTTSITPIQN